jgi:hypothetical protein
METSKGPLLLHQNQTTAENTLTWVLKFIDLPLTELRTGDWMNLGDDFLTRFGFWPGNVTPQHLGSLQRLQQRARKRLMEVATQSFMVPLREVSEEPQTVRFFHISDQDENTGRRLPAIMHDLSVTFSENGHWTIDVSGAEGPASLEVKFMVNLVFVLIALQERGKLDYLRACRACATLFLAEHGRQRFCSAKCKGRDASQRFRERHGEELREKAHVRYEKKVRKKMGRPHQKVGQFCKAKAEKTGS